ncbi:sulfotransferase [Romeria aff. gracilis LEGE 07310]|uniref:Sulfotransferase n=1 Tax=Vasconcelosia minhoensis LEGE 07310 TaxID=915328 RepID=A0A8J7AYR3_9CYAN|nr:sulfotransferase [Romeria gracilis]MBE9080343.1 sulfotransferase [Romeria aff. gracilis LEGE 07310]
MEDQEGSLGLELIDKYRKLKFAASSWAADRGILPQSREYQKFIVLTRPRSGSNLIGDYLGSSSQIALSGEIFQNLKKRIIWNYWQPQKYKSPETLALRRDHPIRFLEDIVFRPYPVHLQAVGFKLFYSQARSPRQDVVWDYLKSDSTIKVIHLIRHNLLKVYLSRQLATKNKSFIQRRRLFSRSEPAPAQAPIRLSYENCVEEFEKSILWQQEMRTFFSDHVVEEVVYEDFLKDKKSTLDNLQLFLGARPERLRTSLLRQSKQSLADSIENYWELKEKFSDTPWADFFTI